MKLDINSLKPEESKILWTSSLKFEAFKLLSPWFQKRSLIQCTMINYPGKENK